MSRSEISIAFSYARAWFSLAYDPKALEQFYQDCLLWKKILQYEPVIGFLFGNPLCNSEKKIKVFDGYSKNKISDTSQSVFYLLVKNKRAGLWGKVLDAFIKIYLEDKDICQTKVFTTIALDEEMKEKFEKLITATFHCKGAIIDNVIDDSIIGGFVLQTDTLRYDKSLKTAFDTLKKNLTNI